MPSKLAALDSVVCIATLIATAFLSQPLQAQRVVVGQHGQNALTFQFANGSPVHLTLDGEGHTAMEFAVENAWHDIATEEGAKQLKKLLESKTKLRLEGLFESKRFTTQQMNKLMMAAGVQIARDCRAIQQLRMELTATSRESPLKNGNIDRDAMLKVYSECSETLAKVDEILVGGIDRKESLFGKVLNSISSE